MATPATERRPFTKFVTPVPTEFEKDPMGALAHAGLDYEVVKRPLYFASTIPSKKSKPIKIHDRYATVKIFDDDEAYIANVGPRYEEIQNRDAFGVSQALVDVGFRVHSLGESRDSKRVFMNLQAPEGFEVLGGEDHHELFVMVRTSHDGTLTLQGLITPIRMFCQNQMRLIVSSAVDRWRFRHLAGAELAFEAETMARLCTEYVDSYQDIAQKLADIDLELDATQKILEKAMPKRTEWHEGILNALEHSPTIDDAHRRTGWGLVNATTEYLEWLREVKTDEARFSATVDGAALRATRKVLRQLTR